MYSYRNVGRMAHHGLHQHSRQTDRTIRVRRLAMQPIQVTPALVRDHVIQANLASVRDQRHVIPVSPD